MTRRSEGQSTIVPKEALENRRDKEAVDKDIVVNENQDENEDVDDAILEKSALAWKAQRDALVSREDIPGESTVESRAQTSLEEQIRELRSKIESRRLLLERSKGKNINLGTIKKQISDFTRKLRRLQKQLSSRS